MISPNRKRNKINSPSILEFPFEMDKWFPFRASGRGGGHPTQGCSICRKSVETTKAGNRSPVALDG